MAASWPRAVGSPPHSRLKLGNVPEMVERPADVTKVLQLTGEFQVLVQQGFGRAEITLHNQGFAQGHCGAADPRFVFEFPVEHQALLQPGTGQE